MARWARSEDAGATVGSADDARTTPEVVASLVVNAQALLAKQVELLTLELRAAIGRKVGALVMLLVATVAGGLAVLLGAITAAIALEEVVAARWQAWGIVALAVLVPVIVLIVVAARLARTPVAPARTREELDATSAWLRDLADGGPGGAA
jgi:MFS family permease